MSLESVSTVVALESLSPATALESLLAAVTLESLPIAVVIALAITAVLIATAVTGRLSRIAIRLGSAPGVIVHEFAHATACRLAGVGVHEVVYFRFGDPAGYVRHEQPARYRTAFAISVAPVLVNTAVAFLAFLALAVVLETIDGGVSLEGLQTAPRETLAAGVGLTWLGLAIGTHAFPSRGDANTLWTRSRAEWRRSPIVLVGIPVVAVIYVANALSWLWAHVFYALALLVVAFAIVGVPLSPL